MAAGANRLACRQRQPADDARSLHRTAARWLATRTRYLAAAVCLKKARRPGQIAPKSGLSGGTEARPALLQGHQNR